MSKLIYWISVFFIVITSCSGRKGLSEQELKKYIVDETHGLHKQISKNDVTIEVFYRPAELVWARDLADISDLQKRKDQKQTYDSLSYFMLHFSRNKKEIENSYVSDPARFKAVVEYLSYTIANDLFLIHDKDTIPALDAVYSRSFGIADGTTVMAVFNKDLTKDTEPVKLFFNDRMLDTGLSEFVFDANDIKNIPFLTL